MKATTKQYLVKPFAFELGLPILIVIPIMVFMFLTSMKGLEGHKGIFLTLMVICVNIACIPMLFVKFLGVRPIMRYCEMEDPDPSLREKALRFASRLPLIEAVTVFLVWAVIPDIGVALTMHFTGMVPLADTLFEINVYVMSGVLAAALNYHVTENSLAPFYAKAGGQDMFSRDMGLKRLSITTKVFLTIIFIVIPPMGYLMGFIFMNVHAGLDLKSVQLGCFLIVLQGAIMAFVNGYFLTLGLKRSVGDMSVLLEDMAKGDLTKRVDVSGLDEIGYLATEFNMFTEKMHTMIKDIVLNISVLASSSTELSAISQQMSSGAEKTSMQSNTVSNAAEEMTSNIASVAEEMDRTTDSLANVASATEQMTSTIGEIAGNSERGRSTSNDAVKHVSLASEKVSRLDLAAQKIGKVTETIIGISSQINLLSLNATIEAARAGSAGKGFAVVAGEIKELAQQTAEATVDINNMISDIQSSTSETIGDIGAIGSVIQDVSNIVTSIAGAIEEQSVTAKDIAHNIARASEGVRGSNERMGQSLTVTQSIAQEITGVNQSAQDITNASSHVQTSAMELSQMAEQLKDMMAKFKV